MRRRKHLHSLRRAKQKRIDVPCDLAKIFAQRDHIGIPASEDQSLVGFYAWHTRKSVLGKIEILRIVTVKRRGYKPARTLVGPAVIRTNEVASAAGVRAADLGTTVP